MESHWLSMAKRLQALAQTGQQFTGCDFDRERYQEIESIAQCMLAQLGAVPLEQVRGLFATGETGYVTPKVEVRGAVIRGGRILLVQEKEDGRWAMPGGYADVGLSAARNVEKEVREEACLTVTAKHLYALRHKASGGYPADARDFYKLHFICECDGKSKPAAGLETHQADFFAPDDLPPLSLGKNLEEDIQAAFVAASAEHPQTWFD
ncbi:MAG: DNA mismatch repair protein MutT [Pseudomonadales bacterium]|nr:DNA mismatch repair protein MutT [Pseudomonadales bacterium]MAQ22660.1 DNA mismatch repair protein MutT [Pseudomonadales bacterium]MAQ26462.1 DNA mismatch repair protein MutT [Pseudomonadales bacterium]HAU14917.1 DNA mismatch repair protein MutT [Gammaproteobacteria bacterium]|tara:strand:+ start:5057 stop:5680 length:624 start_codon:yes stop_codon:yes gene_type:complete